MDSITQKSLNSYSEGKYLVLKGKGYKQHIEIREYNSFKIPFIGRMIKKFIYPPSRFDKVIDYLLEQKDLDGVNDAQKALLKSKIQDYIEQNKSGDSNVNNESLAKVKVQFKRIFKPPPINTSPFHLQGWNVSEENINFKLPDTILDELPRGHDYVIVCTDHQCNRPMNGWHNSATMAKFSEHLKDKSKPIVILIFYPNVSQMGLDKLESPDGEEVKKILDDLKEKGILADYMGVDRGNTRRDSAEQTWQEHEEKNLRSVEDLKKRLGET